MATRQLTDQDMMILRCVDERMTFREMADVVGKSASVVFYHVGELQEIGLLTKPNGKARSVGLTSAGQQILDMSGK